ncbi:AAA family ATPase [Shewanella baltica]|uniref:AAA family ATPase n=1 Tax=Shewanella baltica TaxID=62322 RepID=UPI00217EFE94|nr:AAA family ATPase [Shewanella baltica]MCS6208045.1 AAA family ATPase [Shewanella baltica]
MDNTVNFKISFLESEKSLEPNEVQVIASFDSWNDFGHKIHCRCKLLNPSTNRPFYFKCFIGFLPPENKDSEFREDYLEYFKDNAKSLANMMGYIEHLNANNSIHLFRFFTMLPSMGGYREAVETLGTEILAKVLEALNDLVYYKERKSGWFEEAINSHVFNFGFIRNSEPFFAFNNADSILGGVEEEKFDGISQKLTLKYHLEGFDVPHEIKLNYDLTSCIPKRINILIGKNGLGKSQALKSFCRAALRYQDKTISLEGETPNERPMINRLLAIATPGETQNTFPSERRSTQKLYYRRLSLTRNGKAKTTKSIGELLVQLVRSEEMIGESSRWELFIKALSQALPIDIIFIPLKNSKYASLKELNHGYSEEATLNLWSQIDNNSEPKIKYSFESYAMSSGQLTFFKFALLSCLYIENGSFVLLDEPETHMHPNMISDFVELLDYLLEETGSQALIATHSAYFVREVGREQVHVFSSSKSKISIVPPRLRTFGADVESISQFVFNEDIENRLTDKIYKKLRNRTFESVEKELGDELSLGALMDLKSRFEAKP